jgi:hypothetical protein
MGKKYLETKNDSLESAVLGVWQTAIEEADGRMDGRTKGYKDHRSKLEANRQRREAKKVTEELDYLTDEELDQLTDEEVDLFELDDEEFDEAMKKKSAGDRKKAAKKKAKWAKTAGGKKAAKKSKKRAAKVRKGSIKVDKSRSKAAKKSAKLYSGDDVGFEEEIDIEEAAVNPKDRDELDDDAKDSAKKMKRAQEPAPGQMTEAQSGDKEAYKKFFDAALKKFKIDSPADLKSDEEKKKFYDYIDKNWDGANEKAEAAMSQVREFKISSMKAALAQVWGMEEGKNPFKKEEDEEEVVKNGKTETGKKAAIIDLKPKIKD